MNSISFSFKQNAVMILPVAMAVGGLIFPNVNGLLTGQWMVFFLLTASFCWTSAPRSQPLVVGAPMWILGITAVSLCSLIWNPIGNLELQVLEWFCFAVWLIHCDPEEGILQRAWIFLGIILVTQFLIGLLSSSFFPLHYRSPLFGSKSFEADVAGLCFLGLFFISPKTESLLIKKFKFSLAGVLFAIVLFLGNRSVELALSVSIAIVGMSSPTKTFSKKLKIIFGMGAVCIAVFFMITVCCRPKSFHPLAHGLLAKRESLDIRLGRIKNTWLMLSQNPMGIGPGNFETEYLRYDQTRYVDDEVNAHSLLTSSHTGIFDAVFDWGIFSLLLALGFFFKICFKLRKRFSKEGCLRDRWALAVLLFLLITSQFGFPLQNPIPFFALAIALGVAIRKSCRSITIPTPRWVFLGVTPIILLATLLFAFAIRVEILEKPPSVVSKLACELWPSEWRNCLVYAKDEIDRGASENGRLALHKVIARFPYHFPAYEFLGRSFLVEGKMEEACRSFMFVEKILRNKSDVSDSVEMMCPSLRRVF